MGPKAKGWEQHLMMNDQSQSSVAALRAKSFRGHMYGLDGVRGLAILVVLFHNVGYFKEPADSLAIKILRVEVGAGWGALIGLPADLKYKIATELAQAVITSGDLNQAIEVINDLDRQQLGPNPGIDYALVRMKAGISWFMAKEMDAALTYEEWIKRGNTSKFLRPEGALAERLKYLKEKTGRLSDFKVK
jgi:hypothetical protein